MMAAGIGHRGIVTALLANGAEVNAKDNAGLTALMQAEGNERTDVVDLLKQAGAGE